MKEYITTVLGFFLVWATGIYLIMFPENAMWVGFIILAYAIISAIYLILAGMYYLSRG